MESMLYGRKGGNAKLRCIPTELRDSYWFMLEKRLSGNEIAC